MPTTEAIAGVLIGGQSRRMGACKALLPYRGATFVDRVVSAARSVVSEVVLLGNRELSAAVGPGTVRLADEPGFAGPLAGLVPLLTHAADRWALLIACDMPLLEPAILHRLLDACDTTVDAAGFRVPGEGGEHIPCCFALHPRAAAEVRLELRESASLRALLNRIRCRLLGVSDEEARRLRSFNTPEEYGELIAPSRNLVAADHVAYDPQPKAT